MSKYSIGVDFGTLSARAVLVELASGEIAASSVYEYPHGVLTDRLPCGTKTGIADCALQCPSDYTEALIQTVNGVMKKACASPDEVCGIGIDFTSCTVLPVFADGTPLCDSGDPRFVSNPHAFAKLWKHHGAWKQAERVTELAAERKESFLSSYGGKISSEWLVPKLLETLENAPEVYESMDSYIEAGDWLIRLMTGNDVRNACMAGYKGMYCDGKYPSNDFFTALDPRLSGVVGTKICEKVLPTGAFAGTLCKKWAETLGLSEKTAVSVPIIDAHAALPAAGIVDGGKLMLIMGTSTCHIIMSDEKKCADGICGVVKDGITEGFYAYEAGQACVGDSFAWFMDNCLPWKYKCEADEKGVSVYSLMQEKALALRPGESGLVAVDWQNGCRTPLSDPSLSGTVLGVTLATRPEEIYRAIIEATAYGTRLIIENYEKSGIAIDEIYAAGGIAEKDSLTMQIYADVCGKSIRLTGSTNAGAVGSAMFAAVAGGHFADMKQAAKVIARTGSTVYAPNAESHAVYNRLYGEYMRLTLYFGSGENDVMKRLKSCAADAVTTDAYEK